MTCCAGGPGAPRASSAEAPWLSPGLDTVELFIKNVCRRSSLTKTGIVLQDIRLEPETDPGPV